MVNVPIELMVAASIIHPGIEKPLPFPLIVIFPDPVVVTSPEFSALKPAFPVEVPLVVAVIIIFPEEVVLIMLPEFLIKTPKESLAAEAPDVPIIVSPSSPIFHLISSFLC
jgi:hypothetical protein